LTEKSSFYIRSNADGTIWHFLSLFDTGFGRAPGKREAQSEKKAPDGPKADRSDARRAVYFKERLTMHTKAQARD